MWMRPQLQSSNFNWTQTCKRNRHIFCRKIIVAGPSNSPLSIGLLNLWQVVILPLWEPYGESREDPVWREPLSSTLDTSETTQREERLLTGRGAHWLCFLKSCSFVICDTQMEFSEEESCPWYSPSQRTEQNLLEIPTLLKAERTNPTGKFWL